MKQIDAEEKTLMNEADEEISIDIVELFFRLLENIKKIVAAAVFVALIMLFYSVLIARPVYQATSKLYVVNAGDSALNLSDLQIGSYLASDYQEVFKTWEVQEMVLENLDLNYSYKQLSKMIKVTNPSGTRMLNITVSSNSAQEAANLANEFASVAKKYIAETMETDEPNLLSKALVPNSPVAPQKARNVILGFFVGGLLMCAYVTIQFLLDDKIKNADDLKKCSHMAVLSVVPVNGDSRTANMVRYGRHGAGKKEKNR